MEETAGDDKTSSIAHPRREIESGSEKATERAERPSVSEGISKKAIKGLENR